MTFYCPVLFFILGLLIGRSLTVYHREQKLAPERRN